MKIKHLLLILCVALTQAVFAQGEVKNVLFIGNSYTDVNNLPALVQSVARSAGDDITYQRNTPGGCTFAQHCTNNSMVLIQQGGWDVVVLQEQSQLPSFPDGQVAQECLPYAARLVDSVYAHTACAEPMFYMTWGRKNGDQYNAAAFPPLGTYEGMDSLLYERYMMMAHDNDAAVCPVGRVWRYLRTNNPEIELYSSDESHPSMEGSYAAACAFYAMLFHKTPTLITHNPDIKEEDALTIRNAAHRIVFEQLEQWVRPQPVAGFTYAEGVFTNTSENATSYYWNFGNGEVSTLEQPTYNYPTAGTYTVTLIASRHCMSDTTQQTITANGVGVREAAPQQTIKIQNPVRESLSIDYDGAVELYNTRGNRLLQSMGGKSIDLRGLPAGIYILRANGNSYKVVKI